ncbi:hypothetical protein N7466_006452 [Penicillium verhagenii]|uniref:uncharacterized protein n=1 Tax=Penicillium verhagenii TaxID=1562060 RepID=UPI0025451F99|nr:uncharacterized protein N7466_006452 [Penicillium verhagenii]KAJ5930959.1 hypothetical protein N7466_006452 [Penicillium verhagenii]
MVESLIRGSNASTQVSHPYYPLGVIVDNYVTNTIPAPVLVLIFAVGTLAIFGGTHLVIKHSRLNIPPSEVAATMWFVLCGFIHLFFEGYLSVNFRDVAGRSDIFGQLWKEYSLSDSRYLLQDPFVVCMETVTAFIWGPMSFACAYCIIKDHPLRHPLQSIISLGQLYGDILYFATTSFNETIAQIISCRPETFYFWFYYVFFNAWWIVIPLLLVLHSSKETAASFTKVKALEKENGIRKNL